MSGLATPLTFAVLFSSLAHAAPEMPNKVPRDLVVSAPRPTYPYEARRLRQTGSGIVYAEVDPVTGKVTRAFMYKSTGHKVLDDEAINTFRRWRFKPGTINRFRTPIAFTMMNGGRPGVTCEVKKSSMDYALEPFLGRGRVLRRLLK